MSIEIAFLDVGNADSIIILPPAASAIVIDVPKPRQVRTWLEDRGRTSIDCIYFTHAHQDHLPGLSALKTFISDWLRSGTLKTLCLPTEAIRNANTLVNTESSDEHKKARLRDALDRLDLWEQQKAFKILRGERTSIPHYFGDVVVHILHPTFLFFESQNSAHPRRLNETSLVLKVEYGKFRVLLLSDVEQSGLADVLAKCEDSELECQVIKIPHHGAWQTNEEDFRNLLLRANPELAILSVGSRNQHGHVVPELFDELYKFKNNVATRLVDFVCTEVTRTCMCSIANRTVMGKQGLPSPQPCAGTITIRGDISGSWEMKDREIHEKYVNTLPYPACRGLADN